MKAMNVIQIIAEAVVVVGLLWIRCEWLNSMVVTKLETYRDGDGKEVCQIISFYGPGINKPTPVQAVIKFVEIKMDKKVFVLMLYWLWVDTFCFLMGTWWFLGKTVLVPLVLVPRESGRESVMGYNSIKTAPKIMINTTDLTIIVLNTNDMSQ